MQKRMHDYRIIRDLVENPVFFDEEFSVAKLKIASIMTDMGMVHDIAQAHFKTVLVSLNLGFTPILQCPARYIFMMPFCRPSYDQTKHFWRAPRPLL